MYRAPAPFPVRISPGCSNRQYSPDYAYDTFNSADDFNGEVVCVQEQVFPNGPGGSSFFDDYKCGPKKVSHSLNGQTIDRALCWNTGPSVTIGCSETY